MGDCEKTKRSNKKTKEEHHKHSLFRQYMVPELLLSVQKTGWGE